jgi:RNA polymerase sigma factor (sigma-70 family)
VGILVEDLRYPQPQEMLVRQALTQTMEKLLSMLPQRENQVLRLHFGMEDGKCYSLAQISTILGVSKERVRQIEKQAMERLKEFGADMGLEDFLE